MRKSSIQLMRISRKNSLDHSASLIHQNSLDRFPKTEFGQRLTLNDLGRAATQKFLDRMGHDKVEYEPAIAVHTEPSIKQDKKMNIPEYEFLRSKQQIESDPFLRAKMKYLVTKERPELIKEMPKVKPLYGQKRNGQNVENEGKVYTTLRKESKKENNKKLYLLTVGNSNMK